MTEDTIAWADLECPKCGQRQSRVVDSRGTKARGIRRRRECGLCGFRFTTREHIEAAYDVPSLDTVVRLMREAQRTIDAITRSETTKSAAHVGAIKSSEPAA